MSSKNNGNHPAAKKQPETVIQITDSVIFTSPEKDPDKNKSSDTASQLNKINQFLDDNKVILGLIVTIGTIFISAAMYLYKKGYLSYFIIGAEWNDFADKSVFYLLAFPLCIIVIALFSFASLILPFFIICHKPLKGLYLFLINISVTLDVFLLIAKHQKILLYFLITLVIFLIPLFLNRKNAYKDNHTESDKNILLFWGIVFLLLFILSCVCDKCELIKWNNWALVKVFSLFSLIFLAVEYFFYRALDSFLLKKDKSKKNSKGFDLTSIFLFAVFLLASAGCMFHEIGHDMAELQKSFPIIYMSEKQELQPPDAETIREIRELVTVTTTITTTAAPAQANGSTTTTTTAPPTTASNVPDSAVVYVVLAENKDSYLAAMGKIEGDGAGGILRIDPDCRTVLEKGKQTTVTLTFREVTKDYVYAKEVAP